MDWKEKVLGQLSKGFSKSDIERLSGVNKNNLSSALTGKRILTNKDLLRLKRWLDSDDKPDPLSLDFKTEAKPVKEKSTVIKIVPNKFSEVPAKNIDNSDLPIPKQTNNKVEFESSIDRRLKEILRKEALEKEANIKNTN